MAQKIIAKAFIFDGNGNLLLLRRSEADIRRPLQWDLPGGVVEDGEEYRAACAREIQEEAGLMINPQALTLGFAESGTIHWDSNEVPASWLYFVGETTDTTITLSHEHDAFQWCDIGAALEALEYEKQHNALLFIRDHGILSHK